MWQSTRIFNAADRRRRARLRKFRQFRLRSLVWLLTVAALCSALAGQWGDVIAARAAFRWKQMLTSMSTEPAADVLLLAACVSGLLVGCTLACLVSLLNEPRGFRVVAVLTCLAIPALVAAIGMDSAALDDTHLKDLEAPQVARAGLLWFVCVAPASAAVGWYGSATRKS